MHRSSAVLLVVTALALFQMVAVAQVDLEPNPAPAIAPASTEPVKIYHDGSIRDIGAVGNRNVGCARGLGNWYSLEKQVEMGRSYAHQVEVTSTLIVDPTINEYVN